MEVYSIYVSFNFSHVIDTRWKKPLWKSESAKDIKEFANVTVV